MKTQWLGCLALIGCGLNTSVNAADLYKGESFASLTADRRAAKVGDLITIQVLESSDASNSTDTSTDKGTTLGAGVASQNGRQYGGNLSMSDGFSGRGSVQRAGRLAAQLTVVVQAVQANGDLVVKGDQHIDVHGEKTQISLSGRLRRADIAANNSALSSRLADVRIEYLGDGLVSERSRPGLISRVWTWLGL